jgi:peroxiredoxin
MKFTARLIGLVILTGLPLISLAGKYNAIMNIGDPLPVFSHLPSTAGNTVSSDQIGEQVLVIVSLANHCPWVRGMDKDLVELVSTFEDQSVRFIGLSVNHREDDRLPAMKIHADKNGYQFDYLYDESQALGRKLGATRTPEYFVFNGERNLVYMGALYDSPAKMNHDGSVSHINGEPAEFYVRDAIVSVLSGEQVEINETRAHGCTVKYVQ